MSGMYLMGIKRVSGGYTEGVWRVKRGYQDGINKVSDGYKVVFIDRYPNIDSDTSI